MNIQEIPEEIDRLPHWRVLYRPSKYSKLISDPNVAFDLVRKSMVRLRGWYYPYVGDSTDEQIREREYIASGCHLKKYSEYWRLYYSGQFVHLFSPRENFFYDEPGYFDIGNTLYNVAEIIEFAGRLIEKEIYQDSLQISIQIKGFMDFKLWNKEGIIFGDYRATANVIETKYEGSVCDILAKNVSIILDTTNHIFSFFGWRNPPRDSMKNDLEKFLAGR